MYMLIENLARDRMRQDQYDAEQARQARRFRAYRRESRGQGAGSSGR